MKVAKVFRWFGRLLWNTTRCTIIILIFLGIWSRVERSPLPNGLEIGRRYVWEGADDLYLWTKDGDLVTPFPVDFLCFNDQYIHVFGYESVSFIYDITRKEIIFNDDKEYYPRWRASGLTTRKGCNGYTTYQIGANLIHKDPWKYKACTLSNPCRLGQP